ncbi:Uncharacterised protein [Salmonella enterica subsp. enterica serovar Bovismorbificans]|uniref:Uncharacterized protein n=1 Tax=Salmonella enterica subsp. enterica serovar Bovismorbificans TaxID=58097 RepID=A0A655EAR4_SALET|nr:Uncharacterised protein [Salmonella enterica subsp. enterica serovar Bovismorbificans]CNU04548.1 Uncharacterised protein [Salmonella enterica subsp. enterica serovar Bovismorbificans]CNU18033.1 Uncharacterised protein [Salmonella enterica subsp. enterica serovar Bovismorbificans]CNU18317.1 Uncharacterised protein [Salmonella enterica subsp. enterica serovar Bovismorbificans]CNU53365.1 Uncharacterised protein [Salmonella enterica subsp. enterica serovar Bovismorbificans]
MVSLDHKANAVPACEFGFEAEFFQQIERDLQTIRLFGVDIETDIILARQQRQGFQARIKLLHYPIVLCTTIAWMQGGQLN